MDTKRELLRVGPNRLPAMARFFLLMETAAPVDIKFVMQGGVASETAKGVKAGYFFEPGAVISEMVITSTAEQEITWAVSMGRGGYNTRTVEIQQATGIGNLPVVDVGASEAVLIKAGGNHRGVAFRNDDSNTDRIAIGGPDVTFANAVHFVDPGDVFTDDNAAGAAFYAIAETNEGQVVRVEVRS